MKSQSIKHWNLLFSLVVVLLSSCEKSENVDLNDITGTYTGTLTSNLTTRLSQTNLVQPATMMVSNFGNQIKIHCLAENFDATAVLETYKHHDSIMICLTGEAFKNMYGHALHQGNMDNHMQTNGTEWMQHLNNEHQLGDEHFGGFDMQHHSFSYRFKMSNDDFYFEGFKN